MRIKKIVTISTCLMLLNYLIAQTFEKIVSNQSDQIISSIVEDNQGNFIFVGRIKNLQTGLSNGYLLKINEYGDVLYEIVFENGSQPCGFFNIHLWNGQFYVIGGTNTLDFPYNAELWYLNLDETMSVIDENKSGVPLGKWFSYMNSIIDSDTNIVITGYISSYDEKNNPIINNDPFFYKLSIEGDSINTSFFDYNSPFKFSFDIIENTNNSKYYAFTSHLTNISLGQKVILDKDFNIIQIDSIPFGVYDFYSPIYISDSTILVCGKGGPTLSSNNNLNILEINEQTEIVEYCYFGKIDTVDYPAYFSSTNNLDNEIFIGGTSNLDLSNPFFSSQQSWYYLVKLNSALNVEWQKWYGGDSYYHLYSILATNDGGCIMTGTRYDHLTQDFERDIYIVKVNSEGLITWTQEIMVNQRTYRLFPNPGTDQVTIETSDTNNYFELFDINGKRVFEKKLESNSEIINTSNLSSGQYIFRLYNNKRQIIMTGKWIKE